MTDASLAEAVAVLQAGGVIGLPTETVYGLAANAADEQAVASIYRIKNILLHLQLSFFLQVAVLKA